MMPSFIITKVAITELLFSQLAAELGCKFMEVSAKSGHSVNLVRSLHVH